MSYLVTRTLGALFLGLFSALVGPGGWTNVLATVALIIGVNLYLFTLDVKTEVLRGR